MGEKGHLKTQLYFTMQRYKRRIQERALNSTNTLSMIMSLMLKCVYPIPFHEPSQVLYFQSQFCRYVCMHRHSHVRLGCESLGGVAQAPSVMSTVLLIGLGEIAFLDHGITLPSTVIAVPPSICSTTEVPRQNRRLRPWRLLT
jgi:hypothetical protein